MHPLKAALALLLFTCFFNVEVESLGGLLLVPAFAVAGVITGILGTVLGGITLKIQLHGKKNAEEAMGYGYGGEMEQSYDGGMSSYSTYSRRRRSVDVTPDDVLDVEEKYVNRMIDEAYKKDPTRCLDMLICEVASRSNVQLQKEEYQEEENELVAIAKDNRDSGYAFKRMEAAMKAGFGGSNCKILFDSCPYEAEYMMKVIKSQMSLKKRS